MGGLKCLGLENTQFLNFLAHFARKSIFPILLLFNNISRLLFVIEFACKISNLHIFLAKLEQVVCFFSRYTPFLIKVSLHTPINVCV